MRGFLRTIVMVLLIGGIALGLWKLSGGDIGGFVDTIGNVFYTIFESLGNFFANFFGMFL